MSEIKKQINNSNKSLSNKYKKILELVFDKNLSIDEIGKQMGLTKNGVFGLMDRYGIKRRI